MKAVNLRKYDGESNTKAFFDVETEEGITIKGFTLVNGSKGLFISPPREKSNKDQNWYDKVIIPKELRDELQDEVIKEYGGEESSDIGPPI